MTYAWAQTLKAYDSPKFREHIASAPSPLNLAEEALRKQIPQVPEANLVLAIILNALVEARAPLHRGLRYGGYDRDRARDWFKEKGSTFELYMRLMGLDEEWGRYIVKIDLAAFDAWVDLKVSKLSGLKAELDDKDDRFRKCWAAFNMVDKNDPIYRTVRRDMLRAKAERGRVQKELRKLNRLCT